MNRSFLYTAYMFNELWLVNGVYKREIEIEKKKKEDSRIFLFLISDLIVIEARVWTARISSAGYKYNTFFFFSLGG